MKKAFLTGVAAAMTFAGVALAQSAPTTTIRGTIDAVNATSLDLTARDGTKVTVAMSPGVAVTDIVPAKLSDVKAGSYVGTAAVKQPNGQYRAMELQVFPESKRGTGLGTRPWNLTKKTTMTNGTVGAMTQTNGTVGSASGSGDLTLMVNDGKGMKTVIVPSTVPVVTYQPGSAAELVPGAHVIVMAKTDANGALSTSRISVGKNGLTPPM